MYDKTISILKLESQNRSYFLTTKIDCLLIHGAHWGEGVNRAFQVRVLT